MEEDSSPMADAQARIAYTSVLEKAGKADDVSLLENFPDSNFSFMEIDSSYMSVSDVPSCFDTNYFMSDSVKVFLTVSFVLTIVVCGIGNCLLCFLIARHKRLRSVTNLLIGNLAASDALVALCSAPISLHSYLKQDWTMPHVLCPIVGTVKNVSLYVSVNTLLVIAVDRYIGIFRPLRPRMKKSTLSFIIAGIWIVSGLVSLPTPLMTRVTWGHNCHIGGRLQKQCMEMWHNNMAAKIYVVFITVVEFFLPFFTMGSIYLLIALQLWMHRTPPGNQTDRHREITFVRKQKTIPMLITVVVAFFVCWAPYYAYQLTVNFGEERIEEFSGQLALFYIAESIAMLNSVISTIIYFLMSPSFRVELTLLASRLLGKKCLPRRRSCDIDKEKLNTPLQTHSNVSQGRSGYLQVGLVRKSSETAEARI